VATGRYGSLIWGFFSIDLEIALLADSWRVNRCGSLKFVTDIPSNPGTIMTEIVGEHQLKLRLFCWLKISGCEPIFRELRTLNWRRFGSPSSINRLDPSGESSLQKSLSLNSYFVTPHSRRYGDVTATYIYAGRKYPHIHTLSINTDKNQRTEVRGALYVPT